MLACGGSFMSLHPYVIFSAICPCVARHTCAPCFFVFFLQRIFTHIIACLCFDDNYIQREPLSGIGSCCNVRTASDRTAQTKNTTQQTSQQMMISMLLHKMEEKKEEKRPKQESKSYVFSLDSVFILNFILAHSVWDCLPFTDTHVYSIIVANL